MSTLRKLLSKIRAIRRRPALDRELNDELSSWIDEIAGRYEAQGIPRDAARRRALIETGGLEQVKDEVRDVRPGWIGSLFGAAAERVCFDCVTSMRSLLSTPIPTAVVVITLATTAGLNFAMFGLVNRALLGPPERVSDPSRLFTLSFRAPGEDGAAGGVRMSTSYSVFTSVKTGAPSLTGVANFQSSNSTFAIDGESRKVRTVAVSDNYFALLGARPAFGAGIRPATTGGVGADVIVLSDEFWRSAFAGDRNVLGRHVRFEGKDLAVVGVMPAGFSGHSAMDVDAWIPIQTAMADSPDWQTNPYRSVGVVLVRVSAQDSIDRARARAAAEIGNATSSSVTLNPVVGANVGDAERRIAWWLAGVAALVLLIGLANAATLLVVRAIKRRPEIAIRVALGATRERLVGQIVVEAALLSIASVSIALVMTSWLDDVIRRVLFPGIVASAGMPRVILIAGGLTALLTLIVAVFANLWQLAPAAITSSRHTRRPRMVTALLVAQTAVSVLLLAGAMMFGRSLYQLMSQDLGLSMDGVLIADFEPGPQSVGFGDLFTDALDRVRAVPGVARATPIASLPFGSFNVPPIAVPGRAEPPSVDGQLPSLLAATPDFFSILRLRITDGRGLTESDRTGPLVVIVNETMARGVWPGERAVGKCIRIGFDPNFDPETAIGPPTPSAAVPCRTVIGVARDVRQRSLVPTGNEARLMQYYVPLEQVPLPPFAHAESPVLGVMVQVRDAARGRVPEIERAVRSAIVGTNTEIPFLRVAPYSQLLDRQKRPWELGATLLAMFSALALGVAAVGLYAAFSHAAAERRHEMAIRLALGASPLTVLMQALGEAVWLTSAGVLLGSAAAMLSGRWLGSLLFETSATDPMVLASSAAVMLIVACIATLGPARSSATVHPGQLLKAG